MINQVTLVGRLTRDAQYMTVGQAAFPKVTLGIAVSHTQRTKDGQTKEEVCFVDCILWRQEAEKARELKKGAEVFVTGRLKLESWDDKIQKDQNGNPVKRSKHVIQVETIIYNYKLSDEILYAQEDVDIMPKAAAARQHAAPMQKPVSLDSDFEELPF
jgi:single stranded DNA-binding protein